MVVLMATDRRTKQNTGLLSPVKGGIFMTSRKKKISLGFRGVLDVHFEGGCVLLKKQNHIISYNRYGCMK